jgi:hypothetical protein
MMKMLWRRCVAAAALSLAAAVGGLLVAGTAHAQAVTSGTLSFSGDAGDFISQGKSYSYATSKGDGLSVSSSTGGAVSISVNAYNGDWWTLDLGAPAGAVLAPGTYASAHRYGFNGTGPGLELTGNGRGCNTLIGTFTVTSAVFGPQGYVQTLDATFEQHCEGGTPAARGSVHISNAPAPPQPTPNHPTTTGPHAATTGPHAATGSNGPGAGAAGSGDTEAKDTGANGSEANTPATPAVVRTAFRPLLLVAVGVVALSFLGLAGLITVGIVIAVRRR